MDDFVKLSTGVELVYQRAEIIWMGIFEIESKVMVIENKKNQL